MKFFNSNKDNSLWQEYHSSQFMKQQFQVKNLMQADLIKALDELTDVVDSNAKRINRLKASINENIPEKRKLLCQNGIVKYRNLTVLANKVRDIYLILLDIYTYGTFAMLAKDEWDWRAFARHIYTILYEHSNTVNRQLNEIVKILKLDIDENYDLSALVKAKKEFSSFISEKSEFARKIRINVDAHFDGDFEDRINLIRNLSYHDLIELYHAYNSKMHAFLYELKPVLEKVRLSADISYHTS